MNASFLPPEFLKLYLSSDLAILFYICDITFSKENGHAYCKVTWHIAERNYTWMTSFRGGEK